MACCLLGTKPLSEPILSYKIIIQVKTCLHIQLNFNKNAFVEPIYRNKPNITYFISNSFSHCMQLFCFAGNFFDINIIIQVINCLHFPFIQPLYVIILFFQATCVSWLITFISQKWREIWSVIIMSSVSLYTCEDSHQEKTTIVRLPDSDGFIWKQLFQYFSGIILCLGQANERQRNSVTLSLIGWAHTQNERQELQCNAQSLIGGAHTQNDPWLLQ